MEYFISCDDACRISCDLSLKMMLYDPVSAYLGECPMNFGGTDLHTDKLLQTILNITVWFYVYTSLALMLFMWKHVMELILSVWAYGPIGQPECKHPRVWQGCLLKSSFLLLALSWFSFTCSEPVVLLLENIGQVFDIQELLSSVF